MKKLLLFTVAGLGLALQSCATVLLGGIAHQDDKETTHEQVMNTFTNKDEVFDRFGSPAREWSYDTLVVWHYDLGNYFVSSSSGYDSFTNASDIRLDEKKKYIEFHFYGDEVVSYRTNHVNLGYKETVRQEEGRMIGSFIDLGILAYLIFGDD